MRHIYDMIATWQAADPDGEALRFGAEAWSWTQFAERIRRVAGALAATGIRKGDRVAFLDKNHPACLEMTFGCSLVGAANAVINFRLSAEEIVYIVKQSEARVLFVGAELLPTIDTVRDQLDPALRIIAVGEAGVTSYGEWLAAATPFSAFAVDAALDAALEDTCFLQLYTSGTTGFPKGAMLTHRSMYAHSEAAVAAFGFLHESVNIVAMPLFHVGGTSWAIAGMSVGARTIIVRDVVPTAILDLVSNARATHVFLVPAVFGFLLQVPDVATRDLSSLRCLGYGGSPMPLPLLEKCLAVFAADFYQVYGMTEASGVFAVLAPADHHDAKRRVSAGRAVQGVTIKVVDPATSADVATGEVGEFWMKSAQRMIGYFNDEPASRDAMVGPWLRTGDAGFVDADGYIFIEDRVKDMIISGGENVYPAEVERVLVAHAAVAEVACIGVPDDRWGESVRAMIVVKPGVQLDEAELIEYARTRLAAYKCPKSVEVVEALPRNATGKILKRSLRDPHWVGRTRRV